MLHLKVGAALLLGLGLLGCLPAEGDEPQGENRRERDLRKLSEWVDKDQSFSAAARRQARDTIAAHLAKATDFNDAAFYMEVRRIVGLASNGHSNVTGNPIYQQFGVIPLRAYRFADGLYVVRANPAHAKIVGARIESVDGIAIDELEKRLGQYAGGSAEYIRHYIVPNLMLAPELLHAVGLASKPEQLTLKLTGRDGAALRSTVKVDNQSSRVRAAPWRLLHPDPIGGDDDWSTVLSRETSLPLYLQQPNERFRYVLIEDGEIAYIQLRANIGPSGDTIEAFVERVHARLTQDQPRSIVFDNRQNSGGDLGKTANFARSLPTLVRDGGKVYVITGNATFSAGIYTSFYPQAADDARTVIVGELVGDRPRFWAETGAPFRLPQSGYRIGYSLEQHDLGEGCRDTAICHLTRKVFPAQWNIAVGSFEPEWPVATTFDDFLAGRDAPLARILAGRD